MLISTDFVVYTFGNGNYKFLPFTHVVLPFSALMLFYVMR